MNLIYLDYNCFQRGFDDQEQVKIRMEALACEEIFLKAEKKKIKLVWSFMHEDENSLCPFLERKLEVQRLSYLCEEEVSPDEKIKEMALDYQRKANLSSKDALHLACASFIESNYFITCDEGLAKRAKRLGLALTIMNPVEYVMEGLK